MGPKIVAKIASALYPAKCALCNRIGEASPCPDCRADWIPFREPFPIAELDGARACFLYEGSAARAVKALKFRRATSLAAEMARAVALEWSQGEPVNAIVPVPIHISRRRQRGFNQAELLAEILPPKLVRPPLLRRVRATRPQVGLPRDARQVNLKGAFHADPSVEGLRIMLIDDVMTSGGTMRECAATLRSAGAVAVFALTFAAEP